MREHQEQGRWQRGADGNTRQRVQFFFAVTGAAIAFLCLIARADDGLAARAAPATLAVALLSDVPSHNRVYRASMIPSPDPIERNRSLEWTVEIRTAADVPVEGALLALDSRMPDNESVSVARPSAIAELGDGFYRVEGLRFDLRGWWNLSLRISAAGTTDSLAFNLILK